MLNIYTIQDTKANITHTPFFNSHDVVAKRNVQITVNNPDSTLYHYPEDYRLLKLGTFDDTTGHIELLKQAEHMCSLIELTVEEKNDGKKIIGKQK